jgi:UPF0716 protein FxsA
MRLVLSLIGLLILALPVLELWVLVVLIRRLGLWSTLAMLLATGFMGVCLARWQGWRLARRIQRDLAAGQMPAAALLDGGLILVAALLLILPGFITDVAAFLLLLPPVRYVVRRLLQWWCRRYLLRRVVVTGAAGTAAPAEDPATVEGRVVSVEDADGRLERDTRNLQLR